MIFDCYFCFKVFSIVSTLAYNSARMHNIGKHIEQMHKNINTTCGAHMPINYFHSVSARALTGPVDRCMYHRTRGPETSKSARDRACINSFWGRARARMYAHQLRRRSPLNLFAALLRGSRGISNLRSLTYTHTLGDAADDGPSCIILFSDL